MKLLTPVSKSARVILVCFHISVLRESSKYLIPGVLRLKKQFYGPHTIPLHHSHQEQKYSKFRCHNSKAAFSSLYSLRKKKKKRKEKEGKTLQRDKVGSQCSNINMTSPIPSLQYTLLTSVQKSFLTIWSYSRQEAKTL